jgi:hypothetical protein
MSISIELKSMSCPEHEMTSDQPQMFVERQERKCFLCGNSADSFFGDPAHVQLYFSCRICGTFHINPSFKLDATEEQKATLAAYCRRNDDWTYISSGKNDIERLCALVPQYSPQEKIDRLLHLLGERSTKLGKPANFNLATDYPLIVANGWQEAQFLVGALIQKKFIDTDPNEEKRHADVMASIHKAKMLYDKSDMLSGPVPSGPPYTVTMDGWNRIEELKASGRSLTQ